MPSSKRILYIDNAQMYGGGPKYLLNLLDCINKNQYTPIVICSGENQKFTEELKNRKIEFIPVKTKFLTEGNKIISAFLRIPNFFSLCIKTFKIIRERKIDIVQANLFYSALFGGIAGKLLRKPFIWIVHTGDSFQRYKILTKFLVRITDKIVTVSHYLERIARENSIDVNKFQTIYAGILLNNFHFKNNQEKKLIIDNQEIERPIICMVTRFTPEKGCQYFIEAAKIVTRRISKANFLIIGGALTSREKGMERELKNLIKKIKVSNQVLFIGFHADVMKILSGVDILVLPSLSEGFGLVILEAMATKRPVVASNVGGILEVVVDGETGFLVPPKNPEAIAEKVIFLLKNPQIAKKMGEKGYLRVKENFTQERMVREYEKLYQIL